MHELEYNFDSFSDVLQSTPTIASCLVVSFLSDCILLRLSLRITSSSVGYILINFGHVILMHAG